MAAIHPSPPFDELTYYPTARWIRATRLGATAVDSRRAVLVWEPGKQVPIYAFPTEDVNVESLDGDRLDVRSFDDADLAGYVAVPWDSLEHWFEEDEEVFIHPRDPFARIDVLRSSRHVRAERDGQRLAESDATILLFETGALQAKTVTPLAITAPSRLPNYPDLPAAAETLPGYQSRGWTGVLAPAGLPDDVKQLAPYVLGHRLILRPESRLRKKTVAGAIEEILNNVPVPQVPAGNYSE